MDKKNKILLQEFWPYLLNQAAEATSLAFQRHYKRKYGMLRTEWRVVFHLGRYGPLTAKDICNRATIHKTKVSRAVAALESRRFVKRTKMSEDRRHEILILTKAGEAAFHDLVEEAERYNAQLTADYSEEEIATFQRMLTDLAAKRRPD
jgi:DNA-binding MarR family transcriptional regulator